VQDSLARHLLGLPGLGELLFPPLLGGLGTSLSVEDKVPPPEAAGIVTNEFLVVDVVVLGAGPEGKEVVQRPGELVTAVGIDGLEETERNPDVHCHDVEVLGDGTPENGATNTSETENHDLDGGGIFSSKTERCRVLVVNLVDVFVEEWNGVHGAVRPVVPSVLHDEEDGNLVGHFEEARERYGGLKAEELAHGVEKPDLGELDCEVGEEDEEGALCLFPGGRDFVLFRVSLCIQQGVGEYKPLGSYTS